MSKNEMDPAASTQQFRAFADQAPAEPAGPRFNTGLTVLAIALGAAIVIALAAVVMAV